MRVDTIAKQLFFTTVRIDTFGMGGVSGSGTGFMFTYVMGNLQVPFIVTNKHVVNGMVTGIITFHKREGEAPKLGESFRLKIEDWQNMWYGHPSSDIDIAICPLHPLEKAIENEHNVDIFYKCIDASMIPDDDKLKDLDAIESVTFVGYPNGIWDSQHHLPVARRGTTASPIEVDFEGKPRFLIDASVFGGSSGSPVFIFNQGAWAERDAVIMGGSRLMFVGVIAGVYYRTDLNEIIPVAIPTHLQPMAKQQEMIDLGIVFKAKTVVETIEAFLKAHNVDMSSGAELN